MSPEDRAGKPAYEKLKQEEAEGSLSSEGGGGSDRDTYGEVLFCVFFLLLYKSMSFLYPRERERKKRMKHRSQTATETERQTLGMCEGIGGIDGEIKLSLSAVDFLLFIFGFLPTPSCVCACVCACLLACLLEQGTVAVGMIRDRDKMPIT